MSGIKAFDVYEHCGEDEMTAKPSDFNLIKGAINVVPEKFLVRSVFHIATNSKIVLIQMDARLKDPAFMLRLSDSQVHMLAAQAATILHKFTKQDLQHAIPQQWEQFLKGFCQHVHDIFGDGAGGTKKFEDITIQHGRTVADSTVSLLGHATTKEVLHGNQWYQASERQFQHNKACKVQHDQYWASHMAEFEAYQHRAKQMQIMRQQPGFSDLNPEYGALYRLNNSREALILGNDLHASEKERAMLHEEHPFHQHFASQSAASAVSIPFRGRTKG